MNAAASPTGSWRGVMALFDAWLAAEPAEQEALLARWRDEEPALFPRLQALIEADLAAEAGQFLHAQPRREASPDQRLGPWRLRERIGSGGMGEVWRAERDDGLYAAQVAIKLLHGRHAATEAQRARFAREGELLARLEHPHIARLLDAGTQADGARYLVLELVNGQLLDRWCDGQRLDIAGRLRLFLQVCEAVSFAHAQLVVHRDLKPANILVTGDGQVKLLDFGVAKLMDEGQADSELTRAAAAGLTPAYAAPEQLSGGAISTATDVYALGVLLFQLLSGQRPYAGTDSSPAQLMRDILDTEPLKLSALKPGVEAADARGVTPARLAQLLRSDLAPICNRALQKEPAARYASVQALAEDLQRFLRFEPVSARQVNWRYVSARFVRRNRWGVAAASALALALGAGVGATLWQADKARHQAERAQAASAKATAIKDFLLKSFSNAQMGDKVSGAGSATTVLQLIEQSGKELLTADALAPEVRLELLNALGELQRVNGLNDQAEALQLKALELARTHLGARSEPYVYALVELATNLPRLGRREESNQLFDEALAIMEGDPVHEKGESYAFALWYRGVNAFNEGDNERALRQFERAEAVCRQHRPQDNTLGFALQWQANVHARLDDFAAAEKALRAALATVPSAARPEQLESLTRLFLGDLFARQGDHTQALGEYEHALRLFAQIDSGLRNADRSVALTQAARARHELGQREAAQADLRQALAIAAHHPGGRPSNNLENRALVAQLAMEIGDGQGRAALAQAQSLVTRWPPDANDAGFAAVLVLHAEAALMAGSLAEAQQAVERALPIVEVNGRDTLAARHARLLLAEGLARSPSSAAQAGEAFRQVLATARADSVRPALRARQLQMARALAGLARLAAAAGEAAESMRLAQEGLALLPEPRYLRERQVQAALQAMAARASPPSSRGA
jgi:eukaryotic-like serine/threonine-protein kinase